MELQNKQLGAYKLISIIGKGGMAEVWLANQLTLNREVAVKVISDKINTDDDTHFVERFDREARAIARLDHPSILPVIDYGNSDGYLFLVMPYVRGGTLQDISRREPLSRGQAFNIFAQVMGGLSYAHKQGIVHRDLKPANILMYPDGRAIIADFGVAKTLDGASKSLTQTGSAIGSPEYMAPEQFMGHSDYRTDMYAMGVILYRLMTGRPLYSGTSSWEIGMRHINDPLPLPDPLIPVPIDQFLQKTLQKKPEDRFNTAEEMLAAFHQAARQVGPQELQSRPPRQSVVALPRTNTPDRPGTPPGLYPATPGSTSGQLGATPAVGTGSVSGYQPTNVPGYQSPPTNGNLTAYQSPASNTGSNNNLMPAGPGPTILPATPVATPEPVVEKRKLPLAWLAGGLLLLVIVGGIAGVVVATGGKSTPTVQVVIPTSTTQAALTSAPATTPGATTAPATPVSQPTVVRSTPPPARPTLVPLTPAGSVTNLSGHTGPVNMVSWSQDGRFYLTASDDKTVRIWETATNKQVTALDDKSKPHTGPVQFGLWKADGNHIISAGSDKLVHIYDIKSGIVLIQATDGVVPKALAVSPDGGLVTYPGAQVLHTWNWKKDDYGPDFPLDGANLEITALTFSPDSKYLAMGLSDNRVQIWDAQQPKLLLTIKPDNTATAPSQLAWTPDGKQLVVGRQSSFETYPVNIPASTVGPAAISAETRAPVTILMLSPDGKRVATGSRNGDVLIWSLEDNRPVLQFTSGSAPVIGLHWLPESDQITVASGGSQPRLANYPIKRPILASLNVQLNAQNGTQVQGVGTITEVGNGSVTVVLTMSGLEPGSHKAHIHEGTCQNQGAIKFDLREMIAGPDGKAVSTTVVPAGFAAFTSSNFYFNVHNQAGTPTYVASCGEIVT